jgi:hypothetical protein
MKMPSSTIAAPRKPVSIETHSRIHSALVHAERLATYTLTTIRGRTASEVAAEVAAKVIHGLRSKASNPSRP